MAFVPDLGVPDCDCAGLFPPAGVDKLLVVVVVVVALLAASDSFGAPAAHRFGGRLYIEPSISYVTILTSSSSHPTHFDAPPCCVCGCGCWPAVAPFMAFRWPFTSQWTDAPCIVVPLIRDSASSGSFLVQVAHSDGLHWSQVVDGHHVGQCECNGHDTSEQQSGRLIRIRSYRIALHSLHIHSASLVCRQYCDTFQVLHLHIRCHRIKRAVSQYAVCPILSTSASAATSSAAKVQFRLIAKKTATRGRQSTHR